MGFQWHFPMQFHLFDFWCSIFCPEHLRFLLGALVLHGVRLVRGAGLRQVQQLDDIVLYEHVLLYRVTDMSIISDIEILSYT